MNKMVRLIVVLRESHSQKMFLAILSIRDIKVAMYTHQEYQIRAWLMEKIFKKVIKITLIWKDQRKLTLIQKVHLLCLFSTSQIKLNLIFIKVRNTVKVHLNNSIQLLIKLYKINKEKISIMNTSKNYSNNYLFNQINLLQKIAVKKTNKNSHRKKDLQYLSMYNKTNNQRNNLRAVW